MRIKVTPPATFDDGVNDGTSVTRSGLADKEPVLLADGGRTNGVFHEIVVNFHPAIRQIHFQGAPLAERIINGSPSKLWGRCRPLSLIRTKFRTPAQGLGCIGFKAESRPRRFSSTCHSISFGSFESFSQSRTFDFEKTSNGSVALGRKSNLSFRPPIKAVGCCPSESGRIRARRRGPR